jgi:cytochrome P450
VTQYDAARQALADPRLVRRRPSGSMPYSGLPPDLDAAMRSDMLHLDPPEHTRLRKLVSAAFTQRRVNELAPRIEQVADGLLDKMAQSETVDLIDAFAFPLPMTVIGHLLGVPPGDLSAFRGWSDCQPPTPAPRRQATCSATFEPCSPSNGFRLVRTCYPPSPRYVTVKTDSAKMS